MKVIAPSEALKAGLVKIGDDMPTSGRASAGAEARGALTAYHGG